MTRGSIALLLCMLATQSNLPADASAQLAPGTYMEGEVFVKFRPSAPAAQARRAIRAQGLDVKQEFGWLSRRRGQLYAVVRSDSKTTDQLLAELARDPDVEGVWPNARKRVLGPRFPADPQFTNLWALHNTGQTVLGEPGTADSDIDFPEAWGLTRTTNAEVIIGVVDTGVDYNHPDLIANLWTHPIENPTNGVDDDGNGYVDDYHGYDFAGDGAGVAQDSDPMDRDDVSGHGTHVSGTAAAVPNNGRFRV